MIVKDISFDSPQDNILFDEVLLDLAEQNMLDDSLRFWESATYFVVLGRIGREDEDVVQSAVKEDHIPVLRRASGGGTVVQGPGCLNFTFVLSKERSAEMNDIKKSYQYILNHVLETVSELGVKAQFFPISDLALSDGRKFSGNAQKRGKNYILHHGTILYNFDLTKIERYLRMPVSMPEYRGQRQHLDFVTNININVDQFKQKLMERLGITAIEKSLNEMEKRALSELKTKREVFIHV